MSSFSNKIIIATLFFTCVSHAYANSDNHKKGERKQRPTFTTIDSDQNSEIDFDEFSQQTLPFGDYQTVFSAIDSNSNGVIDEDEYVNFKPPHKNKKGRGR